MKFSPESVIAVLVTYRPSPEVLARLAGHLEQLSHLVVVQNGSGEAPDEALAAFCSQQPCITFQTLSENNLARAQNLGIRIARDQGALAVLLLDDDSEMKSGMLAHLCRAHEEGVGVVVPQLKEVGHGREARYVVPFCKFAWRSDTLSKKARIRGAFNPIASGSLIPIDVLNQVGLMDERLGIDYVDREFCLRLLTRGYTTLAVREALLSHSIGASEQAFLGITLRHHSPERRYTIFRNRIDCWRRYGFAVPAFLIYDMLAAAYDLFRIAAFEDNRKAKLGAALRGALAAWRGEFEPPSGAQENGQRL